MAIFVCDNEVCYDTALSWILFNEIRSRNPQSVLEISCGPGYLISKIQKQLEIPSIGIEKNEIFYLNRVTNNIIKFDFTREKWPFEDKQFDMAHSTNVLCSIKEEYKNHILSEIERTCKRGFHIVKNNIKVSNKQELLGTDLLFNSTKIGPPPFIEAMPKLNFVCGKRMFNFHWENIDVEDSLNSIANSNGYIYKNINKLSDNELCNLHAKNSCMAVYSQNMLNRLEAEDCMYFLEYCWQKIMPGGAIRLGYLNFNKLYKYLFKNNIPNGIYQYLISDNKNIVNFDDVKNMLEQSQFLKIEKKPFNETNFKCFEREIFDSFPDFFDFVEAKKLTV